MGNKTKEKKKSKNSPKEALGMTRSKSINMSAEQKEHLLRYMENPKHKSFANGRSKGQEASRKHKKRWTKLAAELNNIQRLKGEGVVRSVEKWKKCWSDLRSKAKADVRKKLMKKSKTGGGAGSSSSDDSDSDDSDGSSDGEDGEDIDDELGGTSERIINIIGLQSSVGTGLKDDLEDEIDSNKENSSRGDMSIQKNKNNVNDSSPLHSSSINKNNNKKTWMDLGWPEDLPPIYSPSKKSLIDCSFDENVDVISIHSSTVSESRHMSTISSSNEKNDDTTYIPIIHSSSLVDAEASESTSFSDEKLNSSSRSSLASGFLCPSTKSCTKKNESQKNEGRKSSSNLHSSSSDQGSGDYQRLLSMIALMCCSFAAFMQTLSETNSVLRLLTSQLVGTEAIVTVLDQTEATGPNESSGVVNEAEELLMDQNLANMDEDDLLTFLETPEDDSTK